MQRHHFHGSTSLKVYLNRRIHSHRVFSGRGKTSLNRFYGFKLHLVINDRGEPLSVRLMSGNTDDLRPVPKSVKDLSRARGFCPHSLRCNRLTLHTLVLNIRAYSQIVFL
jgi:hypothetical protein